MITLDKIAYTSKILKNNPNEKILYAILTMLTVLFLNNIYISMVVLILMYSSIVYIGGIEKKIFFRLMSIPLLFIIISVMTILFSKVNTSDKYIFKFMIFSSQYGFTDKALIDVTKLVFKSLASISCLYFLILTTPVVDILYTLEKLRLPKILTEITGLVYRYIFVFFDVAQLIYISQHSRLGYKTMRTSFNSAGKLVSSLFLKALKQADESFTSMEARCYNGEIKFMDLKYISSKRNIFVIILINLFFIIINFIFII